MPEKVGDICCLSYEPMVRKFLANPSWTTIHRIKEQVDNGVWKRTFLDSRAETFAPHFLQSDLVTATHLAWEVFFEFFAVPYEKQRFEENGGVIDESN